MVASSRKKELSRQSRNFSLPGASPPILIVLARVRDGGRVDAIDEDALPRIRQTNEDLNQQGFRSLSRTPRCRFVIATGETTSGT